jgi:tetratricopeptide (TPR) repeat protein
MKRTRLAATAFAAALVCATALAQPRDENWTRCAGDEPDRLVTRGTVAAEMAAACTAAIDAGGLPDAEMALALRNRGRARSLSDDAAERDLALADLDRAIALREGDPLIFNARAIATLGNGEPDRAMRDYDEAVRLDPMLARALVNRGLLFVRKGDMDRAIEDYNAAHRADPTYEPARLLVETARLMKRGGRTATVELVRRAGAYTRSGDFARAIEDYDEAIAANPNLGAAYAGRAVALRGLGRLDLAQKDDEQALKLGRVAGASVAPRPISPTERLDRRISELTLVIAREPTNADALAERADTYVRKADLVLALLDYDRAVKLRPKDAALMLARSRVHQAKGDFDAALRDTDASVRLDPKSAPALLARGEAYAAKKQHDRAIRDYGQAIRVDPKFHAALWRRAETYLATNAFALAARDYDQLIMINSLDPRAFYGRGQARQGLGDYIRAMADYDRTLALDPSNTAATKARTTAQDRLKR